MAKEYDSAIDAANQGSYCNFQLPFSLELPSLPPIPLIPIPDLTLDFLIELECPLD
jgi:hypothetical protein